MKKIALLFTLQFLVLTAFAQAHYDYSRFDVGVAGALVTPLTDYRVNDNSLGVIGSITYNKTPYLNFIAELETGKVSGKVTYLDYYAIYDQRFVAPSVRVQLLAGEYMDISHKSILKYILNTYMSTGAGAIIKRGGSEIFIPFKVGYEHKFYSYNGQPNIKLDIGYQLNYILGDKLDGFKSPSNTNDMLGQLVIGLKFRIGESQPTNKPVL